MNCQLSKLNDNEFVIMLDYHLFFNVVIYSLENHSLVINFLKSSSAFSE